MKNPCRLPVLMLCLIAHSLFAQDYSKYKVKPVVSQKAKPFDLNDVRILEGSPFKHAMDLNAKYLLELDADRLLHRWRKNAGFEPKAPLYKGWEETSSHMLGHYLSALAIQYAASGDKRFLDKANYVVDELATYQKARGTGYVGGIPNEDKIWKDVSAGKIRSGGFDLNGGWVPWYMLHKAWAGLVDAYLYTGNSKAKDVVVGMSDWAYKNFIDLPDSSFQKMMVAEFGGMNESLAQVYAITGNKKYLDLSYKFYHKSVMDPLSQRIDKLGGLHANTQIPKVLGAARQYELTGNKREYDIADFFFHAVVNDHSYVNGGNSNYEWFNQAGKFDNVLGTNTSETCNTYNMLKMDKYLFSWNPSAKLADYYERALYNHILASQHPETGMFCYYVALQSGKQKVYSTPFESFWCCVGSGIENHAKYGEAIYFQGTNGSLYVNLFIPSTLNWKEQKVVVQQETKYPKEETTIIKIDPEKASKFAVNIRKPDWAEKGMTVSVNGRKVPVAVNAEGYVAIERTWRKGDVIKVNMPMHLYTEAMPDAPHRTAVLYGPLLLTGVLGKEKPDALGVPVLITKNTPVTEWVKPVDYKNLIFSTASVGQPKDLQLKPFYEVYDDRYVVYWDLFTEEGWKKKKASYEAELKRQAEIEKRTIDVVRLGEQQSEKDHNLTGSNTGVGSYDERKFRDAPNGGWFSFEMKVDTNEPVELIATYNGGERGNREFDILVDDVKIFSENLKGEKPRQFVDHIYPLAVVQTKGKSKVVVKYQALPKNIAGGLFEIRLARQQK